VESAITTYGEADRTRGQEARSLGDVLISGRRKIAGAYSKLNPLIDVVLSG